MRPSTIITAMRRRVGIVFFSCELSAPEIVLAVGKTSALHRTWTQYLRRPDELKSDSRSDVTSNDGSVKVNDTQDGAQAATMVFEARCAGSCLLRDCRSCDDRRILRRYPAK